MTASADTQPGTGVAAVSGFTVRLHAALALAFLAVGVALVLISHGQLAWPSMLEGSSAAEYLGYGRAYPMGLNALVFGWLTFGLLAGLYYFVPRLVGGRLAYTGAAAVGAVLLAVGVGSGVVAIGIGESEGGRLLEMPWYSDLLVLAAVLVAAVVISGTARHAEQGVGVPVWYAVAAPWWLFLGYGAGAVPGLEGVDAALQSAFGEAVVIGLWVVPAAIGIGYGLIAQQVPDATFHPRLGRIGFWSIGLLWGWTAARTLQYGPTADWLETIPVLFASGLVVAALVVATDFALALRGRFDEVMRSTSLGLFSVGTALFLLVPGFMLVQSLRSSSAVIRFTAWEQAFDLLTLLGAFTFWTAAAVGHVVAPASYRRVGGKVGRWAMLIGALFAVGTRWVAGLQQGYTWVGGVESGLYSNVGDGFRNTVEVLHGTDVLTVIGLSVFAFGALLFIVGLGLPMADDASERGRGPVWLVVTGFAAMLISTGLPTGGTQLLAYGGLAAIAVGLIVYFVGPLIDRSHRGAEPPVEPEETVTGERRLAGFLLVAGVLAIGAGTALPVDVTAAVTYGGLAAVLGGFVVLGAARDRARAAVVAPIEFDWPDTEQPSKIRRGAVGVLALAALAVFVLPTLDDEAEATLLADTARSHAEGSLEARGAELYVVEGCWYCHTQQVRAVVTDLGLGPVSVAGDYVYDGPGVLGVARIGPDLMHAGSREPTSDPDWIADHLVDPRAERPWSTMPSFSYLSDDDLTALAAYVAGLE